MDICTDYDHDTTWYWRRRADKGDRNLYYVDTGVKGVTPLPCLGVLAVREKMRSASDSCWLATGRASSHKNFASIPLYSTWMTTKIGGYSP